MDSEDEHPGGSRPGISATATHRSLGLLYVYGGLVAFAWLLLPEAGSVHRWAMASMAASAVLVGALVASLPQRWRHPRNLHAVLLVVQLIVAVGFVASLDPRNDLRFFWAWAAPYSALFFSRRAAAAHAVWVGVLSATSLAVLGVPFGSAVSLWMLPMGTLVATAALTAWAAELARSSRERLRHLALHDSLTGMPNRRYYAVHVAEALARRDRDGGEVAVALLDLDDFKLINDTYGHETGDELLGQLALRLTPLAVGADLVARLGGDEFVVVLAQPGPIDVAALASRIASAWLVPFSLQDGDTWASGSIGVSVADRHGASATSLLREADAAMYRAKTDATVTAVYDDGMRAAARARLELDSALQQGLQDEQLQLHYQPIVDLVTGRWHGAEALLRWEHPAHGNVPPSVFIPIAEQTRLIVPMGDWVLRTGLRQLAQWRRDGVVDDDFVLSVNVSPRQLGPSFLEAVRRPLRDSDVPPRCLALELTESVLVADSPDLTVLLLSLRAMGVAIHLDDFGTGYSPLTYLERVPFDLLKIDRGFTAGLVTSPRKAAVVTAILAMAEALGVPVTAEGVETHEQAQALLARGCRFAQGHLYAQAAPAAVTAHRLTAGPTGADDVPELVVADAE